MRREQYWERNSRPPCGSTAHPGTVNDAGKATGEVGQKINRRHVTPSVQAPSAQTLLPRTQKDLGTARTTFIFFVLVLKCLKRK